MFADNRLLIRGILFFIIIGTLPFYIIGFWVLGNSTGRQPSDTNIEVTASVTPIGADVTSSPTPTQTSTSDATPTEIDPLQPTAFQFIPPTRVPTNTPSPTPTNTVPPTSVGDRDGDGVLDNVDQCPDTAGSQANGCPTT